VQRLFFYSHLLESISRVYFFFDAQDVVDELTIRDRLVKAKPEQVQQVGHLGSLRSISSLTGHPRALRAALLVCALTFFLSLAVRAAAV